MNGILDGSKTSLKKLYLHMLDHGRVDASMQQAQWAQPHRGWPDERRRRKKRRKRRRDGA
jgi:hypothetical protein